MASPPAQRGRLAWLREDGGGNCYRDEMAGMEGWLCPALFCYFEAAPPELYVRAEALRK